jgi:hypothetical protein
MVSSSPRVSPTRRSTGSPIAPVSRNNSTTGAIAGTPDANMYTLFHAIST